MKKILNIAIVLGTFLICRKVMPLDREESNGFEEVGRAFVFLLVVGIAGLVLWMVNKDDFK